MDEKDIKYIKVNSKILSLCATPLPFDIYLQRSEDSYTRLFAKGQKIDNELLTKYCNKGLKNYYILNEEKQTYHYYVEKLLESSLSDPRSMSSNSLHYALQEMILLSMTEIADKTSMGKSELKWVQTSVKASLKTLDQDFDGLCRIIQQLTKRPHQISHSFTVAIISLLLGKALGFESDRTLVTLGVGGLIHDIGMSRLSICLNTQVDLGPEEWKEIKEHPIVGARMVDQIRGVGPEVRDIVLQHHERINGMGYPNGLYGKDIFPLAKVVAIADVLTSLITQVPYRPEAMSIQEAFDIMNGDVGSFDKSYLKALEDLLLNNQHAIKIGA